MDRSRVGGRAGASLEGQIIAAYAAAGWTVGGIFLAREADVTLGAGLVSSWVNHGTGGDATGVLTTRPTWNTGGLNSLPSLDFDGGDCLETLAIDSGAATAYALSVLFTDADTAARFVASFGEIGAGAGLALKVNTASDQLGAQSRGSGASSRAESTASHPMISPAVVTATWDTALLASEVEIRHAGVNVTSTRPVDGNASAGAGSQVLTIGGREGPTNQMTGSIAALCLAWGSTTIPTTEVGEAEALIAAEWGV